MASRRPLRHPHPQSRRLGVSMTNSTPAPRTANHQLMVTSKPFHPTPQTHARRDKRRTQQPLPSAAKHSSLSPGERAGVRASRPLTAAQPHYPQKATSECLRRGYYAAGPPPSRRLTTSKWRTGGHLQVTRNRHWVMIPKLGNVLPRWAAHALSRRDGGAPLGAGSRLSNCKTQLAQSALFATLNVSA